MTVNPINAAAAYTNQNGVSGAKGMEPRNADPIKNFSDMLGEAVSGAIEAGRAGEAMSMQAVVGNADLREVVSAVTNAEISLQTAIAIRDRVVQAYQDILTMPI